MAYELPNKATFNVDLYAENRVIAANQFRESVVQKFRDTYEEFWGIHREEIGPDEMQAIIDRLGATGLDILQDAQRYSAALEANYPGELPQKYLSSPYETKIVNGRLVLGDVKPAWLPPPEETEEGNESENEAEGETDGGT